jgi:hypothetical protein
MESCSTAILVNYGHWDKQFLPCNAIAIVELKLYRYSIQFNISTDRNLQREPFF